MLSQSLSLAGLTELTSGMSPRAMIEWAAGLGYRGIQLDATAAGVRARDLDRSGRRDLAALLRRGQIGLSGLDLWIPPGHFADAAHADRAVSATVQALELAAELAKLVGDAAGAVVSVSFSEKMPGSAVDSLSAAADRVGARLADHAWPVKAGGDGPVGIGVDPAELLMLGADPAAEVSRLAAVPAAARLSDFGPGGRVAAGSGKLDVLAYQVALATKGYGRAIVVDLRGVRDQEKAAREAIAGGA